ncbi:nuclease-related domain-containing DEAD/DEAH box helicase [Arthrobacter sp. 162MFSha1.1]|uniref:nuclease-related domain-containing DEAD/DEAH box helicase n=1 Tax=Arthrobacter sp. 162MFSha1.1 TaxID=1151119 RepID=UPI0003AA76EB|nr:NERD domain-containing protein [Arthrobacter sp. 162MFSha1.1]
MKMIPDSAQFGAVNSTAELKVARLLSAVSFDEPAVCLYSVNVPKHDYKRMSEVDFLIIFDDAVIAIEVKGGRISRREGLWAFTNRYGETTEKREGPFEQARSGLYYFRSIFSQDPLIDVAYGYLVITPDSELPSDPEWVPEQYAGPVDLTPTRMKKVLENARKFAISSMHRQPRGGSYSRLTKLLRPDFDRILSLQARSAVLESSYVRLAESQYNFLVAAERNKRIVCEGGAGTGKTLLAAESARRLNQDGRSVLVTCRSPRVAELLSGLLADTAVKVYPFDRIPEGQIFDALVVDEGQDLLNVDDVFRLESSLRDGLDKGCWRLFADPNNQAHVDGHFSEDLYDEMKSMATLIELSNNCRNTANIVLQTQLLTGADLGSPLAGKGPQVVVRQYSGPQAGAAALESYLSGLSTEGVRWDEIAVVSLCDSLDSSIVRLTSQFRRNQLIPAHATSSNKVSGSIWTAAAIKGLEAAHVCVVDVDPESSSALLPRLYVAMTRPRVSLALFVSERGMSVLHDTMSLRSYNAR